MTTSISTTNTTSKTAKTASKTSKTVTTATNAYKVVERKTIPVMDKAEAIAITKQIKSNLETLPKKIVEAMAGKAHLAMGYKSIDEWSKAEFGLGRSRIYQFSKWLALDKDLRETFNLNENWEHTEEHYRHLNTDAFNELVDSIMIALNDANVGNGASDEGKRGVIVGKQLQLSYASHRTASMNKERASKKSADGTAETPASIANTVTPTNTAGSNVYAITRMTLTPELVKVKSADTARILTKFATDDETMRDRSVALMALNDARNVLEDLIGFYSDDVTTDNTADIISLPVAA